MGQWEAERRVVREVGGEGEIDVPGQPFQTVLQRCLDSLALVRLQVE